jgi:CrcB protein
MQEKSDIITYLVIGAGGGLGAICRFILAKLFPPFALTHFPLQILLINLIGCFLLGILMELMAFYNFSSHHLKSFLFTGFLGGFTTFSAFALDFGLLVNKNLHFYAILYAVSTVTLCILGFFVGIKFTRFAVM